MTGSGWIRTLAGSLSGHNYALHPGTFPDDAPEESGTFDAVWSLAVLEHVRAGERAGFAAATVRLLRPGGDAVLTVPAPAVDRLLT